jgi:hypothetical protein
MLAKDYVPVKPFPEFKWKWACLQCTEGINDPAVLLGVLSRMRKLEKTGKNYKYSSPEFAQELIELDNDLKDSVGIDLARRTGERNLIRNSGQYWKTVGLIPSDRTGGHIQLTDFGRKVADRDITQTEFSAITIQTFKLPNTTIQTPAECSLWESHSIVLYPLRIILGTIQALGDKFGKNERLLTVDELIKIIIPLSASHATLEDYANFIFSYRHNELDISNWPDCCLGANDKRIAREYFLFLSNYGYLIRDDENQHGNIHERYLINETIEDEIVEILAKPITDESLQQALADIRNTDIVSQMARKTISSAQYRPKQAKFRHRVLEKCQRCIITNVQMSEVLEAAHIKPHKYSGPEDVDNGFAMRTDIHILFDTGNLRISVDGDVELSDIARINYGWSIPPRIVIPEYVNKNYLQWRWDNYVGI